ncbi:GNAT family N-acetyltransferase [Lachnoclostridium phytofermentans]|uniref:GNAT family N-acetyltransferase n=1 Tax=Lachnoclostridium phytofermentans TaxID=66219 RepID=UPI000498642F|nr:GNAT family protein [Lachnoclostridium phytofermentans]
MKIEQTWENDGFLLRPARTEDAEEYFSQNFNPLDREVARLTGSKEVFTHDEVVNFFIKCIGEDDRYDFLIIAPDGRIIGESVINEIDWDSRSANYRISLFHSNERGKGIGSWAIKKTRDFAFERLKLHRLELDVFSFNTRAEKAYITAGFKREGVLRDAIWDGENYADDILMAILEKEWKQIKDN